ncbi:MAG: hypothetical protein ACM3NI_10355 [Bacteroidota bacterium]
MKKRSERRSAPTPNRTASPGVANPKLDVHRRKVLRTHYAAKYRTR